MQSHSKSTRYTKQGIRLKALDFSSRDVLVEAFQLGTPTGGSRCYCTVTGLAYDLNYHADLKRWRLGSLLTFNVAPPSTIPCRILLSSEAVTGLPSSSCICYPTTLIHYDHARALSIRVTDQGRALVDVDLCCHTLEHAVKGVSSSSDGSAARSDVADFGRLALFCFALRPDLCASKTRQK